ncbi:MAG: PucR family transcriptional regulator [Oscillospiraceae bacterium]|nr:PucR family transcriptional regulator [Oscillospiraceae bacterium]
MITFDMLLKMPALKTLNVVAGINGLNREIKVVSIMDAPDSYKWLKGGELILTTAYLFGGDSKLLELALMNLIDAGSSGLGIKKDRFLKDIPEELIIIADKHQFPILEIPYHFGWSDIIASFYELLYNVTENTHCTIEPHHIKEIYNAGRWGSRQLMEKLTEYFRTPLAVLLNNKKIQMDNGLPGVKLIGAALESAPVFLEKMGDDVLTIGKYFLTVLNIPFLYQHNVEYLAVMSQDRGLFAEIRKLFHFLSDLVEREKIVTTDKIQVYRKFMISIVSGKVTKEEIHSFEAFRGTDETIYSGIMLIFSSNTMAVYSKVLGELKNTRLLRIGKANPHIVDNISDHEAIVMFELDAKDDNESYKEWQRIFFDDIEYSMQEYQDGYISMGRFYSRLEDIVTSYMEAREAYFIGQRLWEDRRCFSYSILSAYSVLHQAHPSKVDLSYIEILNKHKAGFSFDCLSTLEAYFRCDGYKKAADKLQIHENTMRYRLQRISDFLHLDIDDPIVTHSLVTQIMMWRLLQNNGKNL